MKKRIISILTAILLVVGLVPIGSYAEPASVVTDEALNTYLCLLGYDTDLDDQISAEEMATPVDDFFMLDITGLGVQSLEGLQYADWLMFLEAADNEITDFFPIASLENLVSVNVSNNGITGALPDDIISLPMLMSLTVSDNSITSVGGIENAALLSYLDVSNNDLDDVSEIETLASFLALDTLYVQQNRFSLDPSGLDYAALSAIEGTITDYVYTPQRVSQEADSVIETSDALRILLIKNGVATDSSGNVTVSTLGNFYGTLNLTKAFADNVKATDASYVDTDLTLTDIDGLEYAINASGIYFADSAIADLSPLENLASLETLSLQNMGISDLDFLSSLTSLTSLDLSGNEISDISDLASLTSVTELDLSDNRLTSIGSDLGAMTFTTLDLSNNILTDETELTSLTAGTLDVRYNNLFNITGDTVFANVGTVLYDPQTEYEGSYADEVTIPDAALRNYLLSQPRINVNGDDVLTKGELYNYNEYLNLNDLNVTDLTGVEYMKNTIRLRLNSTGVTDLSPVAGMTRLQVITATSTDIEDITPLMNLQYLQSMNFSGAQVTDLSPFESANMPALVSVIFSSNGITDADALANVPGLTSINLSGNEIDDADFLSAFTSLANLDISHNQLTNIDAIYDFTTLVDIDISYNKIPLPSNFEKTLKQNNAGLTINSADYTPQLVDVTIYYVNNSTIYETCIYGYGEEFELIASPEHDSSMIFNGWLYNGAFYQPGSKYSTTSSITFYANWTENTTYNINITAPGTDNYFSLTIGGAAQANQHEYHGLSYSGTVYTVTAIDTEENPFLYWKNDLGKIVSYEKSYSFTVVYAVNLIAVFENPYPYGNYVSFLTEYDQELSRIFYDYEAEPDEIEIPVIIPPKFGYTFIGWSVDGKNAITDSSALKSAIVEAVQSGDVNLKPIYRKDNVYYNVTVENGSGAGSYLAMASIEVKADAPESGYKFAYWVNESGEIVSYLADYKFMVFSDVSLTAVYVPEDETVTTEAIVRISSATYNSSAASVTFVADRYIPDEDTLVQAGMLLTSSKTTGEDEELFVIGGPNALKGTTSNTAKIGTYMLTKTRVSTTDTWYARAYAVYMKADSEQIFYVYSDIVEVDCSL